MFCVVSISDDLSTNKNIKFLRSVFITIEYDPEFTKFRIKVRIEHGKLKYRKNILHYIWIAFALG